MWQSRQISVNEFLDKFQTSEFMFLFIKILDSTKICTTKNSKFGDGPKFLQEAMGRNPPKLSKWILKPSIRRFEFLKNLYAISSQKILAFQDMDYSIINLKVNIKHPQASVKGSEGNEGTS